MSKHPKHVYASISSLLRNGWYVNGIDAQEGKIFRKRSPDWMVFYEIFSSTKINPSNIITKKNKPNSVHWLLLALKKCDNPVSGTALCQWKKKKLSAKTGHKYLHYLWELRQRIELKPTSLEKSRILNQMPSELVEYNKWFLDKGQSYVKWTRFSIGFYVLKLINCGEESRKIAFGRFPYDGNRLSNNYQLSV